MNIHLARDGSALGLFTEAEVRAGLESGRFLPTDLAWREGMPAWTTLSTWPEFVVSGAPSPATSSIGLAPSEFPWEVKPGLKSLFQSAWLIVARPAVLANARFGAGSVFAAAYLVVALLFIPVLLLAPLGERAGEAFLRGLADALIESGKPESVDIGQKILAEVQRISEHATSTAVCSSACLLVFYPLICGLVGLLLWPGLRMQGAKVQPARLCTSSVSIGSLSRLLFFPAAALITLISFVSPALGVLTSLVFALTAFGFICRAQGAAAAVSGWCVLLSYLLLIAIFCIGYCCCSCLLGFMFGAGSR